MGRWTDYEIQRDFTDWSDLCDAHNADCDAYEARIAELEAKLSEAVAEAIWEADTRREDAAAHAAELARVKAESLRVVKINEPCSLSSMERVGVEGHTNTCTVEGADWRIYAAERRVDDSGHRYLVPVSDEWPSIAFGADTKVQPVRLERWEMEE